MATACAAACVDVPGSEACAVAARGSGGAWPGAGVAPAALPGLTGLLSLAVAPDRVLVSGLGEAWPRRPDGPGSTGHGGREE